METGIPVSLKRKSSSPSQIKGSKRKRIEESKLHILRLPDCVLLKLLEFLDATSLYQLGKTCVRFENLVQDESLWIHVDGRSRPNNQEKADFCWKNVHRKTKRLILAGERRSDVVMSVETLIMSKELKNLTTLALEHQYIKYCTLSEFPSSLQELSFKCSYIHYRKEFFAHSAEAMSNLKTLILDHCKWFEAEALQSLSKYPKLEILSLYMCKKVTDNDISTICLAGRCGFKNLKVADMRFTGLGDCFLSSFLENPGLQIVYFQCFPTTYYLERYRRKLDIANGMTIREHSYMSDDEANNNLTESTLKKRFGADSYHTYRLSIKDTAMAVFNKLNKTENNSHKDHPKSYLYRYPYDECTCGFFDEASRTYGLESPSPGEKPSCSKTCGSDDSDSSSDSDDEDSWDPQLLRYKLQREIRKQHYNRLNGTSDNMHYLLPTRITICANLVPFRCTNPAWSQVPSTPNNRFLKWLYLREPRNDYEIAMFENADKFFFVNASYLCDKCGCVKEDCSNSNSNVFVVTPRINNAIPLTIHRRIPYNFCRSPAVPEPSVTHVIDTLSQSLEELQTSRAVKHDAAVAVLDFLAACNKFLDGRLKISSGSSSMDLRKLFCSLASTVKQNFSRVLNYHNKCFEELLRLLHKEPSEATVKLFFRNLLNSEASELKDADSPVRNLLYSGASELKDTDSPGPSSQCPTEIKQIYPVTHQFDVDGFLSEGDEFGPTGRFNMYDGHLPMDTTMRVTRGYNELRNRPPAFQALLNEHQYDVVIRPLYGQLPSNKGLPTSLSHLSLRGYLDITDQTLHVLRDMNLKLLDVTGTRVTRSGILLFMQYNPQCRLIHETACTCRPNLHF